MTDTDRPTGFVLPKPARPCERCGEAERRPGERYCDKCRRAIVAKIRSRYGPTDPGAIRDLSHPGTEAAGRDPLPFKAEDDDE